MRNQTRINKESIRDQSGSNTNFPTTYTGPAILRRTKGMPTQLKPLHALGQVRTLHGLIPICAWCKKTRNDEGYWRQIEAYISEHTEAARRGSNRVHWSVSCTRARCTHRSRRKSWSVLPLLTLSY